VTTPPVQIVGFSSTDFVPGFVGETVFGAGKLTAADLPLRLHLVGNKLAAGSKTPNVDTDQVFTEVEADAYYGAGAELARMFYAAVRIPGVSIWCSPVTQSAGAQATMTITIATNASSDGELRYWIAGDLVVVPVTNGETPTTVAARIVSRIAQNTRLGCTAGNAAGVATLTWKQAGPRGNDAIVFQDVTKKPSAMTSTLGGAGGTVTGGGQKFGGGTTADDFTAVATNTFPAWFNRVALACVDSTNLAAWETNTDSKAGPLEGRPEHVVVGFNGALAAAQSLTQTTLNNPRFNFLWMLNGESMPSELAAVFAAVRCATEQGDPNADYDDIVLPGIAPHRMPADIPQRSTKVSALQTGVTPVTTVNSQAQIVRSITTRCLNGANPDYRTLDTGTAVVPDFVRTSLGLLWASEYKKANPIVADDPAPEQPERASGIATPKRWSQYAEKHLKDLESGKAVASGLPQIIDVDLNKPASGYDKFAKRIMSVVPVIPAPRNHQIGVSVQQL
jgi:phage tail sheath gpL-like